MEQYKDLLAGLQPKYRQWVNECISDMAYMGLLDEDIQDIISDAYMMQELDEEKGE